jgi:hypothetical protein
MNCMEFTGDPLEVRRLEKFLRGYSRGWDFRPVIESREESVRRGILQMPPFPCHTYETAVPIPPETLMKDFSKTGYDWQVSNWGCKWDIGEDFHMEVNDGVLSLSWESPWGPPREWAIALAGLFPMLEMEMTYIETGNAFAGRVTSAEGSLTADEYSWPDPGYKEIAEEYGYEIEDDENEEDDEEEDPAEEAEPPSDGGPGEKISDGGADVETEIEPGL